eukprot:GHVT01082609.1.p1 GENE.GHVT01082609.1~~GHVT01082609.1.p1  ORF type:complete len:1166 (+),score=131.50 GHVT01082609.1:275-3772(+)
MKTTGKPDHIHISKDAYELVKDDATLIYEERSTYVKGKGAMNTYLLVKVVGSYYPNFANDAGLAAPTDLDLGSEWSSLFYSPLECRQNHPGAHTGPGGNSMDTLPSRQPTSDLSGATDVFAGNSAAADAVANRPPYASFARQINHSSTPPHLNNQETHENSGDVPQHKQDKLLPQNGYEQQSHTPANVGEGCEDLEILRATKNREKFQAHSAGAENRNSIAKSAEMGGERMPLGQATVSRPEVVPIRKQEPLAGILQVGLEHPLFAGLSPDEIARVKARRQRIDSAVASSINALKASRTEYPASHLGRVFAPEIKGTNPLLADGGGPSSAESSHKPESLKEKRSVYRNRRATVSSAWPMGLVQKDEDARGSGNHGEAFSLPLDGRSVDGLPPQRLRRRRRVCEAAEDEELGSPACRSSRNSGSSGAKRQTVPWSRVRFANHIADDPRSRSTSMADPIQNCDVAFPHMTTACPTVFTDSAIVGAVPPAAAANFPSSPSLVATTAPANFVSPRGLGEPGGVLRARKVAAAAEKPPAANLHQPETLDSPAERDPGPQGEGESAAQESNVRPPPPPVVSTPYSPEGDIDYAALTGQMEKLPVSGEWLLLKFSDEIVEARYRSHFYSNKSNLNTVEQALVIFLVAMIIQTVIHVSFPRLVYQGPNQPPVGVKPAYEIYWIIRCAYTVAAFVMWLLLHYRSHPEVAAFVDIRWSIFMLNLMVISAACVFTLSNTWGVDWSQFSDEADGTFWLFSDTLELFAYIVILHHNTGLLFQNCIMVDIFLCLVSMVFFLTTVIRTEVSIYSIALLPPYFLFNLISAFCKEFIDRLTFVVNEHARTTESRATELLNDMLPKQVLEEFQQDKLKLAYRHDRVTFLFADICGFTSWAKGVDASEVVTMLQKLFAKFDRNSTKFGLYKLCTIGDAYVAVSEPVTEDNEDYDPVDGTERVLEMATSMIDNIMEVRERLGIPQLSMRIGLHYGKCVGGVIGSGRLRYDLWGMDVLTGNMMESEGSPGKINVSEPLKQFLLEYFPGRFTFEFNRSVFVINTYVDSYLVYEKLQHLGPPPTHLGRGITRILDDDVSLDEATELPGPEGESSGSVDQENAREDDYDPQDSDASSLAAKGHKAISIGTDNSESDTAAKNSKGGRNAFNLSAADSTSEVENLRPSSGL